MNFENRENLFETTSPESSPENLSSKSWDRDSPYQPYSLMVSMSVPRVFTMFQ